jgi:hypothetical protein
MSCAQMVGKPLIAPDPAATPTAAAAAVPRNPRRVTPASVSGWSFRDLVIGCLPPLLRRSGLSTWF